VQHFSSAPRRTFQPPFTAELFYKKLVDRHFFSERNEINRKVGAATMLDFFLSR
jgi:hypothetical protein